MTPPSVTTDDVMQAWATPLFNRKWEDVGKLNRGLRELISAKEQEDTGVRKSVVGGWHSTEDFLTWQAPEILTLIDMIKTAVATMTAATGGKLPESCTMAAWANVLRTGGYNKVHTHPGCVWSGVYYVHILDDDPKDRSQGWIEFQDPRPAVEMNETPGAPFGTPLTFPPEEGRMFVFPAWLRHAVYPYLGTGERISVAFNVRM